MKLRKEFLTIQPKRELAWLRPTDKELEAIKQRAKEESSSPKTNPVEARQLIGVDLLRLIAALRFERGGCPNCGRNVGHSQKCLKGERLKKGTQ